MLCHLFACKASHTLLLKAVRGAWGEDTHLSVYKLTKINNHQIITYSCYTIAVDHRWVILEIVIEGSQEQWSTTSLVPNVAFLFLHS